MSDISTMTISPTPKAPAPSWRSWLRIHPAAELFPMMGADALSALAKDIKDHGLRLPVTIIKENGAWVLVDGRNRLDALARLGRRLDINDSVVFQQVSADIDVYAHVVSANIHRRHLTAEQKRELIGELLKADPKKSDRQIGAIAKADGKTVAAVRVEKEARAEIPHVEARTDTRGRNQPTTNSAPPAEKKPLPDSNPLVAAWDRASPKERDGFLKARRVEITCAQQKIGGVITANHDRAGAASEAKVQRHDDGLDIPPCLQRAGGAAS